MAVGELNPHQPLFVFFLKLINIRRKNQVWEGRVDGQGHRYHTHRYESLVDAAKATDV